MSLKIAIGSDHAGYEYKNEILHWLQKENFQTSDFGPYTSASIDYPDVAHPLSLAIEKQEFDFGILLCGSANGMCMTANKHQGVRAGLAWNTEVAALIRLHNNCNLLCLPARFMSVEDALKCVKIFLNTEFEAGRHAVRVDKISI